MSQLRAGPAAKVQLGRASFTPEHRVLTEAKAFYVTTAFPREHLHRMRLITRILGWGDHRDDAAAREFVRATRSSHDSQPGPDSLKATPCAQVFMGSCCPPQAE